MYRMGIPPNTTPTCMFCTAPSSDATKKGHRVVKFKDVTTNKFVAVAVDVKIGIYGASKGSQDNL